MLTLLLPTAVVHFRALLSSTLLKAFDSVRSSKPYATLKNPSPSTPRSFSFALLLSALPLFLLSSFSSLFLLSSSISNNAIAFLISSSVLPASLILNSTFYASVTRRRAEGRTWEAVWRV